MTKVYFFNNIYIYIYIYNVIMICMLFVHYKKILNLLNYMLLRLLIHNYYKSYTHKYSMMNILLIILLVIVIYL